MEAGFTKVILILDVPQGIRTPVARNVKVLNIGNKIIQWVSQSQEARSSILYIVSEERCQDRLHSFW